MNKNPIAYVGWLLLLSALCFYVYGIFQAVYLSWGSSEIGATAYHPVLSSTVGSIQALLLTNMGILLGVSVSKPESAVAKWMLLGSTGKAEDPLALREQIQLFALVLYLLSLIVCIVTWIKNDFSLESRDVVSIVPESGKMFIGVVLAYLTAVLRK